MPKKAVFAIVFLVALTSYHVAATEADAADAATEAEASDPATPADDDGWFSKIKYGASLVLETVKKASPLPLLSSIKAKLSWEDDSPVMHALTSQINSESVKAVALDNNVQASFSPYLPTSASIGVYSALNSNLVQNTVTKGLKKKNPAESVKKQETKTSETSGKPDSNSDGVKEGVNKLSETQQKVKKSTPILGSIKSRIGKIRNSAVVNAVIKQASYKNIKRLLKDEKVRSAFAPYINPYVATAIYATFDSDVTETLVQNAVTMAGELTHSDGTQSSACQKSEKREENVLKNNMAAILQLEKEAQQHVSLFERMQSTVKSIGQNPIVRSVTSQITYENFKSLAKDENVRKSLAPYLSPTVSMALYATFDNQIVENIVEKAVSKAWQLGEEASEHHEPVTETITTGLLEKTTKRNLEQKKEPTSVTYLEQTGLVASQVSKKSGTEVGKRLKKREKSEDTVLKDNMSVMMKMKKNISDQNELTANNAMDQIEPIVHNTLTPTDATKSKTLGQGISTRQKTKDTGRHLRHTLYKTGSIERKTMNTDSAQSKELEERKTIAIEEVEESKPTLANKVLEQSVPVEQRVIKHKRKHKKGSKKKTGPKSVGQSETTEHRTMDQSQSEGHETFDQSIPTGHQMLGQNNPTPQETSGQSDLVQGKSTEQKTMVQIETTGRETLGKRKSTKSKTLGKSKSTEPKPQGQSERSGQETLDQSEATAGQETLDQSAATGREALDQSAPSERETLGGKADFDEDSANDLKLE